MCTFLNLGTALHVVTTNREIFITLVIHFFRNSVDVDKHFNVFLKVFFSLLRRASARSRGGAAPSGEKPTSTPQSP